MMCVYQEYYIAITIVTVYIHVYLIKWNNSWKGLALSNKEGVACGPFGLTGPVRQGVLSVIIAYAKYLSGS